VSQRSIGGRSAEVKGECDINNPLHRQLDNLKVPVGLAPPQFAATPMLGASAELQNHFFDGSAVALGSWMSQPAWEPKPPFTYMPRLDEHHAPAQDTSGLSASIGYFHHDLRPHPSRQPGPRRSWLRGHVTADCRASIAQP
jgi:hypothetical protein